MSQPNAKKARVTIETIEHAKQLLTNSKQIDVVKQALLYLKQLVFDNNDETALTLLLQTTHSKTVITRRAAVSLVTNRLFPRVELEMRIVDYALRQLLSRCNVDSVDSFEECTDLYFALCTRSSELLLKLLDWFESIPAEDKKSTLTAMSSLMRATVNSSVHLVKFVESYSSRPRARPLILACLAAKWKGTGNNENAVKAGTKVSPPNPPSPTLLKAVITALNAMEQQALADGKAEEIEETLEDETNDNETTQKVIVLNKDNKEYSLLLAFALPFVHHHVVSAQIGAICNIPAQYLGSALRVYGVERLPSAVANRRYPSITLPLSKFLLIVHTVDRQRARLPVSASVISLGLKLCSLDYNATETLFAQLESHAPLPSLLMKTLLLICETYPTFKNLAISALLRLSKRTTSVWDDAVLWKGFCIACVRLQPLSFAALAELPTIQREQFFVAHSELFEPFREHVAAEKARLEQSQVTGVAGYVRPFVAMPKSNLPADSTAIGTITGRDVLFNEFGEKIQDPPEDMIADNAILSTRRAGQVRLLSYSVLADCDAQPQRFPYCAPSTLDWEARKKQLAAEILLRQPDIVCLQNMDHFEDFFKPEMHKEGYASIFKQRTGNARDGVGVIWRVDRYRLVLEHKIEFNNLAFVNPNNPASRRMLRDSVALVAVLEPITHDGGVAVSAIRPPRKRTRHGDTNTSGVSGRDPFDDTRQRLLVTSVALCNEPRFDDVRVMQTKMLLETLEKLVITTKSKDSPNVPVLICGGFNAPPESPVYELLSKGVLSHQHSAIAAMKLFQPITHRLSLRSAYANVAQEPPFTQFTPSYIGTSDYIFYASSHLSAIGVLDVANRTDIERDTALPSEACASDHQCLMTVLEATGD